MKSTILKKSVVLVCLLSVCSYMVNAQAYNPEREKESIEALNAMIEATPKLNTFKNDAYAYVIFPKVTKAGIGIGGAAGRGIVYKGGTAVGGASLKQASIGLQLGGQQYSEAIFFENKEAYDHFVNGNLKFDAQASAVAITAGASFDVAYNQGVAVFTRAKGGLMYEASIGGQHFDFQPIQ
ncbi:MAG: hypothetical protein KC469_08245 [Flavobacteriaceae bacterium]|nr:hypothetical protein [Flavobacteriaceae bacterium]